MLSRLWILSTLFALGCRASVEAPPKEPAPPTPTAPAAPLAHSPTPAKAPHALPSYTLVLIKTGPKSGQLTKEENDRAFAGHFANMGRMSEAGQLLVAGPYGERRHDSNLRGIFVLATSDRAEAERWASTDPTTQAGVFVLEYHALATDAPLAASHERAMAWVEAERAAGRTPAPGEHARTYVWLTAEHGDLAQREFAPLQDSDGGVYLIATLDGTRALVLLDADNLAMAEERFAPQLAAIGSHALDEWFGTDELAAMVGP
jgi:uncharacterized protein YciI